MADIDDLLAAVQRDRKSPTSARSSTSTAY